MSQDPRSSGLYQINVFDAAAHPERRLSRPGKLAQESRTSRRPGCYGRRPASAVASTAFLVISEEPLIATFPPARCRAA